jgi:hypothetical protein
VLTASHQLCCALLLGCRRFAGLRLPKRSWASSGPPAELVTTSAVGCVNRRCPRNYLPKRGLEAHDLWSIGNQSRGCAVLKGLRSAVSLRATRASCLELPKNYQPTYENSRATAVGAWCVELPSRFLTSAVQGPRIQATKASFFDLLRSFKLKRPYRLRHNLP